MSHKKVKWKVQGVPQSHAGATPPQPPPPTHTPRGREKEDKKSNAWAYRPVLFSKRGDQTAKRQNQQNDVCPTKTWISLGIRPIWSLFAVRMKKYWVLNYLLSAQWWLGSDWAMPRLMSLRWTHTLFYWFCHAAAQIGLRKHENKECKVRLNMRFLVIKTTKWAISWDYGTFRPP